MKSILKNTVILLVITLVATVALSFVYSLTKDPIAQAEAEKTRLAYQKVYTAAASFEDVKNGVSLNEYNATLSDGVKINEVKVAMDADGNKLGYVFSVEGKGYKPELKLALGIDVTGTVVGYDVISQQETAGIGDKCKDPEVREQFIGITDVSQVDGISGATRTSNGLRAEAKAALDLVKRLEGDAE